MKEYIIATEISDDELVADKPATSYGELVLCKDCKTNPYNKPASVDVVHGTPERCWDLASRINAFCSEAERKEK